MAAVLRARTVNPDTSIIDRGLFVLNDVLCEEVPAPEGEALQAAIEEQSVPASSGLSQRERFASQRRDPLCAGCHNVMDPLGEPFLRLGAAGQFHGCFRTP